MNPIKIIKDFLEASSRILRVSQKPTREEFTAMVKVISIGIALMGVLGFVIYYLFIFLPGR